MAEFQGTYVVSVRDALLASALSGQHALLLSAPGYGKTTIALSMARRVATNNYVFTRLDMTTGPERIEGLPDPTLALGSPPQYVLNTHGTPFDPNASVVILDEMWRASDPIVDMLIKVLDRLDIDPNNAPTVWATSNFVTDTERAKALEDRFAFYVWLNPPKTPDVPNLVREQMNATGGILEVPDADQLPEWSDIVEVRSMRPGVNAIRAVSEFIETLSAAAMAEKFIVNPRRIWQWQRVLYRTGVYYSGMEDFDVLPQKSAELAIWLWPTFTQDQWLSWNKVASGVVDTVATAVEAVIQQAYKQFKSIRDSRKTMTPGDLKQRARDLSKALKMAKSNLDAIGHSSDPRIEDARKKLEEGYARILSEESNSGA